MLRRARPYMGARPQAFPVGRGSCTFVVRMPRPPLYGGRAAHLPHGEGHLRLCGSCAVFVCVRDLVVTSCTAMLYRDVLQRFVLVPEWQSSRSYSDWGPRLLSPRGPPASGVGWGHSHSHSQSARACASSFPRGARCVQGRRRAGADFSRVRLALGLPADRPTHSSRQAARWGIRWCACGRRARGGAGAVACQVPRWFVWSCCAGSRQPGRVR